MLLHVIETTPKVGEFHVFFREIYCISRKKTYLYPLRDAEFKYRVGRVALVYRSTPTEAELESRVRKLHV